MRHRRVLNCFDSQLYRTDRFPDEAPRRLGAICPHRCAPSRHYSIPRWPISFDGPANSCQRQASSPVERLEQTVSWHTRRRVVPRPAPFLLPERRAGALGRSGRRFRDQHHTNMRAKASSRFCFGQSETKNRPDLAESACPAPKMHVSLGKLARRATAGRPTKPSGARCIHRRLFLFLLPAAACRPKLALPLSTIEVST